MMINKNERKEREKVGCSPEGVDGWRMNNFDFLSQLSRKPNNYKHPFCQRDCSVTSHSHQHANNLLHSLRLHHHHSSPRSSSSSSSSEVAFTLPSSFVSSIVCGSGSVKKLH